MLLLHIDITRTKENYFLFYFILIFYGTTFDIILKTNIRNPKLKILIMM